MISEIRWIVPRMSRGSRSQAVAGNELGERLCLDVSSRGRVGRRSRRAWEPVAQVAPVVPLCKQQLRTTVAVIEVKCGDFNESFGEMESLISEFSCQLSGCGD